MMLFAPGMFCTIIVGLPGMCLGRCLASNRAVESYPPPGLYPTAIVIVFPSYGAGWASTVRGANTAKAHTAANASAFLMIVSSPPDFTGRHGAAVQRLPTQLGTEPCSEP